MTHKANGHVAVQTRRDDAKGRMIERNERGQSGQVTTLDERLGAGAGAKKERARLAHEPTVKTARKTRRGKKAKA